MNSSPPTLTSEEQEQLLQTIQMFEVIVQASPHDCQSMEILKDAYYKLGRQEDALTISRRLADSYVELGQFSQAVIEYESILQNDPANPEVISALGEVEDRLYRSAQSRTETAPPPAGNVPAGGLGGVEIEYQPTSFGGGSLITTQQTLGVEGRSEKPRHRSNEVNLSDDGNDQLAKFLIQNKLVAEEVVMSSLERLRKKNADRPNSNLPLSLVDEISRRGAIEIDALLIGILERSKFAYIPLEYYDVDRAIVKMLPEELTVGRLIVPFDVMSRTLMIAMANPFDVSAKESVQQLLDYNIQWHLASPGAVAKALSETYKIGSAPDSLAFRY
jgi:tetratricopeptide (TPR) repeat protein